MKATLVALVFAAGVLAQNAFHIDTPSNAVVCQPLKITWSGGTPPYFLSVVPGAEPNGQPLENLGTQNGTSFTWLVNQQPNTSLGLALRSNDGSLAQSAPFTVNAGGDTSCVGKPATGSAGTEAPPPTTGGATTPPATGGATTPAPTSTSPTSGSRPTSASSGGASQTGNAASANFASVGAAGVVGAALAALFA